MGKTKKKSSGKGSGNDHKKAADRRQDTNPAGFPAPFASQEAYDEAVNGGTGAMAGTPPEPDFDENIQMLVRREQRKREADEETATAYVPEKYQYFQPDEFEKGLHIPEKKKKEAQELIAQDRISEGKILTGTRKGTGDTRILADGIFTVSEKQNLYYDREFHVHLVTDRAKLRYADCENWTCSHRKDSKSYFGRTLCVHEIAALLRMEDYLKQHTDIDATTPEMYQLMRSMARFQGRELKSASDMSGELLTITPALRHTYEGALACTFKVGSGRPYVIHNLNEFRSKMESGSIMRFGKKTDLQLGRAYLDEKSRSWYDFLSDALWDESARNEIFGEPYSSPETKDRLYLYGERLDRFLELAQGMTLECREETWHGTTKEIWTVGSHPLRIHLTLTPDIRQDTNVLDGVLLQGKIPPVINGIHSAAWLEKTPSGWQLNQISADDAKRLAPLLRTGSEPGELLMRVGRNHLGDFYHKILPQIRKIAEVTEENPELVGRYLPPEPEFTLYLDYEQGTAYCRPEAAYGREIFSLTDQIDWQEESVQKPSRDQFRDDAGEMEVLNSVLEYFDHYDDTVPVLLTDGSEDAVFNLLDHGLDELLEKAEVRTTERFRRIGLRRHVRMKVGVSLRSNLLDLSVTSQDLSEDELLNVLDQYRQKRRYVRLRNGDFLKIQDNEAIEEISQMMDELHLSVKDLTKGKMHIPAYRSLYLDKMLEGKADLYADRDRHFRELIKGFKTVSDSDYEIPANLADTIRPYQREGYQWLRTLDHFGFGGILADEMGLGKTLQALAVLEAVHDEEAGDASRSHTSIVICPASLVYNWAEEVKKFAPSLTALTVTGTTAQREKLIETAEDYDLLITSYDLLKRDIQEYEPHHFRFEIIDEAQYIKNHSTAAAKSVKLIDADTRFALTGTPIENRLSELWSIFDYLMPGFLYEYTEFRDTMEKPIVKYEDEDAMDRLRRMIGPFILRRRKADVLRDLPDKIEEIHYAGMGSRQQKLYDAQVVKMRREIQSQDESSFRKNQIQILAELMRIRQICCDPDLCFNDYHGGSCKTEMCMDLITSLKDGGHKALLFSQFTSMLEILKGKLDEKKIPYYVITGQTPKEKRLELVNQFNNDDTPVFLISLKAGGTGLNLTGADSVIHYDPWWNTAAEDQATDRAHRIGQKNVVTVYKLVVKGTIEERIIELQNRKAQLAEDLLSGESVGRSTFTRDELLGILE